MLSEDFEKKQTVKYDIHISFRRFVEHFNSKDYKYLLIINYGVFR